MFRTRLLFMPAAVAATAAAVIATAGACGAEEPTPTAFQKVMPAGRTFDIEAFFAVGFKQSKRYNVEELPGAIDARFGFWTQEGAAPKEYEIRFYPSHDDAIEAGTAPAEDVAGPDANLKEEAAVWKEGHKDRRTIYDYRAAPTAKYQDFAIFGNVVLLCEGKNPAESLEYCASLISRLLDPNER